jgi:hypothetical protein
MPPIWGVDVRTEGHAFYPLVQTLIDFDAAPVFAVPVIGGLGDATAREGMLLEGRRVGVSSARSTTAATRPPRGG